MVKVPENSFSGEASFLGLQMATFLLCLRVTFPLCVSTEGKLYLSSWSYKDTN